MVFRQSNSFKPKRRFTFKTEMCISFECDLFCPYGMNCQFAHGLEEVRSRSMPTNFKTKLCKNIAAYRICPYMDKCTFIHDLDEARDLPESSHTKLMNRNFNQKYKTKECNNWRKYRDCKYGNNCIFLHGPQDKPQQTTQAAKIIVGSPEKLLGRKHNNGVIELSPEERKEAHDIIRNLEKLYTNDTIQTIGGPYYDKEDKLFFITENYTYIHDKGYPYDFSRRRNDE